jgi:hypothetical protein
VYFVSGCTAASAAERPNGSGVPRIFSCQQPQVQTELEESTVTSSGSI